MEIMYKFSILIIMISIGTWNIRGALYDCDYLTKVADNCDVLTLTEHWLTTNTETYLDKMADKFDCTVRVRSTQRGHRGEGGVAILVKQTHGSLVKVHDVACDDVIAVTISRRHCIDISIVCALLPSTNHNISEYTESLNYTFETVDELNSNGVVIVCGDFNTDIYSNGGSQRSQLLLQYLSDRSMVDSYSCGITEGVFETWRNKTHTQYSILDYVFVPSSLQSAVVKTTIDNAIPFNVSDHYPVTLTFHGDILFKEDNQLCVNTLQWHKADSVQLQLYGTVK